jgi:Transposase IS116/IS110/IS902 family.
MEMYDTYQHKIAECDRELEAKLKQFAVPERASTEQTKIPNAKKTKRIQRNAPGFNLTSELHRITGVDLSRIDGVNAIVAQTIISEVGLDMTRWKTEAHFASWLGLCPDNRISGDKVLARGTRHVINRAATALRMAATTIDQKPQLPGRAIPTLANQAGSAEGDHRDGSSARPAGIPHAEIRSRVRRQGHSVLRAKTS